MRTVAPLVMIFSASDPTCGAGLQADALTVAALGAHPLTVVTGLTAQNTLGVDWFEPLPAQSIQRQLDSLLADVMPVSAIKAGVLGSVAAVEALRDVAERFPKAPLVIDPVMASGRGDRFGQTQVFDAMRELLWPLTTLLTPNWPEACALARTDHEHEAVQFFLEAGCKAVLLKGEHRQGVDIMNTLYAKGGSTQEFPCVRLQGQFHGSGCTLASACAAGLAKGNSLSSSVSHGLGFTWNSLRHGLSIGQGQSVPDRLSEFRDVQEVRR